MRGDVEYSVFKFSRRFCCFFLLEKKWNYLLRLREKKVIIIYYKNRRIGYKVIMVVNL